MRWLVNYFRQVFCKHDFEKSEMDNCVSTFDGEIIRRGTKVHLFCKKCSYHKNFWKY